MISALEEQQALSQIFIAHLVARNYDLEEDLSDSGQRRLAAWLTISKIASM
jgi:hypothetical protein